MLRKPFFVLVAALGAFALATIATDAAPQAGPLYSVHVDDVSVNLWVPPGLEVLRGIVVKPADKGVSDKEGIWQATIRSWKFAEVGMMLDDSNKSGGRETQLAKALPVALKQLAEQSGHKELETVPLVALGMSRGGGWAAAMCRLHPDRAIGYVSVCSWMGGDASKADPSYLKIPGLFVIGSVPDGFKMLPSIDEQYVPAMKQGGVDWTCALSWGAAHNWRFPTSAYCITYLDQVIKMRVPEPGRTANEPVKLTDIDWEAGWAGDKSTWDTACPSISSLKEFKGDRANRVWQPNRYLAYVWRAYMTKSPALRFEDLKPESSIEVKADRREYLVGTDSSLSIKMSTDEEFKTVRFYDGDIFLGESSGAHPTLSWKVPAGTHAVIALGEKADGTLRSSPVLWVVGATKRP